MNQILLALTLLTLFSCESERVTIEDRKLQKKATQFFTALNTSDQKLSAMQVNLGRKLYFETALSKSGTISCNSCHNLETFGVDNQPTSPGHDGTLGGRNSPTTLNAYKHFKQFWDGRAADVEEQALGPLLNPIEHGLADEKSAMRAISSDEYIAQFKKAFPKDSNPHSFKNLGRAIGAFERTLNSQSPFDDYLDGNVNALTRTQRAGLSTFIKVGCTTCHSGELLGGDSFQKLGLVNSYETEDKGLYEVTKKKRDMYKFKVPSLRNIEKTYPYFHDGSVDTLDKAISLMAYHQLGKEMSEKQIKLVKAFLASLTETK
jgi:cytochrome c peroxidase